MTSQNSDVTKQEISDVTTPPLNMYLNIAYQVSDVIAVWIKGQ